MQGIVQVPGGWMLDGAKRWIGNGTWADVVVVWARNSETRQVCVPRLVCAVVVHVLLMRRW
jgi:alkylation response protein AidB-like acyl-CoA dehydrogenase